VSALPPGGTPFEVTAQRRTVRGTHWGEGPVVYLVHGWSGRGAQLGTFVEPLVVLGHQVVLFDAPSHGSSDPGPNGARTTDALEFGRAFDAVAARFGPASAVIAHSMGAMVAVLTLKYGWLSTDRLVMLAPMVRLSTQRDAVWSELGVGPRTARAANRLMERRVGHPVAEFDLATLIPEVEQVPTLIVHDLNDPRTSYDESKQLAADLPAQLMSTAGLGHQGVLRDPKVLKTVVEFVSERDADEPRPGRSGIRSGHDHSRTPARRRRRGTARVHLDDGVDHLEAAGDVEAVRSGVAG
jgi:pimeloyl-ACP methyl ester carboxylesterase